MRVLTILIAAAIAAGPAIAQSSAPYADAVNTLIESIGDDALVKKAMAPFASEDREAWHFFPKERNGLHLSDLDEEGRAAVLAMLKQVLSDSGYTLAEQIRSLESVLADIEGAGANFDRNPLLYVVSIYGQPDAENPWGLRYEGHHLSLNWTFAGGKVISSSPEFLGSNPAVVLSGPKKGLATLGDRKKLALDLLNSLDEKQRGAAILGDRAPRDIVTGADRVAAIEGNDGLKARDLSVEQKGLLRQLVAAYLATQRDEAKQARIESINKGDTEEVTFSWMGSEDGSGGHYYRIQGPTFVAEYANTQNDANHIHTIWRDFEGDFGRDVLAEHYAHDHTHPHSDRDHAHAHAHTHHHHADD